MRGQKCCPGLTPALPAGGTDIISCFMGQNTSIPVYKGEIQARNLAMAVEAWDEDGECPPCFWILSSWCRWPGSLVPGGPVCL